MQPHLDWYIFPGCSDYPCPRMGYSFGPRIGSSVELLAYCPTPERAEEIIRRHFQPRSVTLLDWIPCGWSSNGLCKGLPDCPYLTPRNAKMPDPATMPRAEDAPGDWTQDPNY
jgi:hypothetical protein